MWKLQRQAAQLQLLLLPGARRGYTNAKLQRQRKAFESKTYPRAATEEPERLPRRGRRGGWMRTPARGVAKLDGTNVAQGLWWEEHQQEVDKSFIERLRESKGEGPHMQQVLDQHLAELDALRVSMPPADDFRNAHIRKLASVVKRNPMHEATQVGPPLSSPPVPQEPEFLEDSLQNRRQERRRGRFMGRNRGGEFAAEDGLPPGAGDFGGAASLGSPEGGAAVDQSVDEGFLASATPSSSSSAGRGRRSRGARQRAAEEASDGDLGGEEGDYAGGGMEDSIEAGTPIEPMEPLRTSALSDLWSAHGASWAEFNRCVVPSEYPGPAPEADKLRGAVVDAHRQTREAASLFDVSYKVGVRVTGADREFVADQFLTCNLRAMRVGDVQYACVLDSKGLILDDAFVYLAHDAVEILTSGCHSRQMIDYLGHYIVYVRRTGADVAFEESHRAAVVALQGPRSCEALTRALSRLAGGGGASSAPPQPLRPLRLETAEEEAQEVRAEMLESMPYMSFLRLRPAGEEAEDAAAMVLRVGSTGEDGFEVVAPPGEVISSLAATLLEDAPLVRPAGVHCLDMLRMEAGLPRVGADIVPGKITPVRASLIWTLDQAKMRAHLMFGWQKLFFQLAKGPKFRRVALLLEGPGHAGCRLLSNPHRQPIGEITSVAWSPSLRSRVAQAYVRPEYAKANKHVLVTVPFNLPTHKMRKKAIKHWVRAGPLRSAYRRLVAACVAPLPIVPHRYPEPARQRKAAARTRPFSPDDAGRGRMPPLLSSAPPASGGGGGGSGRETPGKQQGPARRGGAEPGAGAHRGPRAGGAGREDAVSSDLSAV